MRDVKKLLDCLSVLYPPPSGAKHAITVYDDKLWVGIAMPQPDGSVRGRAIVLDDQDMDKSPHELVVEIVAILAEKPSGESKEEATHVQ